MKRIVLALLFSLPIMGCQTLGLATPQTTDQKLAYAYGSVTGVLNSIADATNAGALSSAKATQANQLALQVKATLDAARAVENTDEATALQDLNMATAALAAVQQFLTANGVKK